uniref:Glutamate receptor 1.2-like n=1 Tax=Tanacetum cinerariifolium TaxID=118510 RepID=A0A699GHW3_TANCI|nr:glutamate receptor 1.2-like [Tanacetum cinerariifolium]
MAISDFYALRHNYRTRLLLHTRDSKGDPIEALSAVDRLLNNTKVQAIIGPETYLQSKLLAMLANRAKVPIFSFAALSSMEYPYLFQIKEDAASMAKSIADLLESYHWRNVTFIYEDTDDGKELLPYLVESFYDKNIRISYSSVISASAMLDEITQMLRKLMTFHTRIIIVHMSPSLASTLFLNARRLGMVGQVHAWILTHKTVDVFRSKNFNLSKSLQGALGLRPYVPASTRLYNLTARWHNLFYRNYPTLETKEVPVSAIWAYDTVWALAESVEKAEVSHYGPSLLNEVLKIALTGISGQFQLSEGKVISNGYEIIDYGEMRVGYWTPSEGIRSVPLYSGCRSRNFILAGKIRNFKFFMDVNHDSEKNVTTATGFSKDVFDACLHGLPYEVSYVLISYENATYDDLVRKVFNQEIDAVVGDSTILANRSQYVDFTATYSDLGIGTLGKFKKHDMWFFLKPLHWGVWLTAIASLIVSCFVIWFIERMNNEPDERNGFGTIFWLMLMTIFFAQEKTLNRKLSKFVLFIWLIVVLILITGYTATLASLLTSEQFELASKDGIVGFHGGSFMRGVTISNLHFENHNNRPFYSYDDYAHALSKHGEADAIVDEIPYIKMFLGKYSGDYALVSSHPITSGFGFIFQKGSPLVQDVSREIAKMRLDGTLGNLEKKWFQNGLFIASRNSTRAKALKLDSFGGVFIVNEAGLALALIIASVCALWDINRKFIEIMNMALRRLNLISSPQAQPQPQLQPQPHPKAHAHPQQPATPTPPPPPPPSPKVFCIGKGDEKTMMMMSAEESEKMMVVVVGGGGERKPRKEQNQIKTGQKREARYDVRGNVGAGLRRARDLCKASTTRGQGTIRDYVVRGELGGSSRGARNRRGRFTSCEESWPSRYDVRGTVGAGLRRARKVGQVATTCEEPSGQVYVVRGKLAKSLRRARNRRGSRYDVRGTVGADLCRARKLGQVATTCEEPSGQVYVVRGKLAKSLRRARNRRGRFTSCEETWSSRYDVRGTVGAGLRRARKVGQVATTCEEPSVHVYVVRGNLVKSLRRARNRRGRFTSCEESWSSRYDVRGTVGAGALTVYDWPRNVDNLGFGCLLSTLSGTKIVKIVGWNDRYRGFRVTTLRSKGSLGHAFTVRIRTGNQNQTSFYPSVPHEISVLVELILGHMRYLLTDVPPQPNFPPDNVFRPD